MPYQCMNIGLKLNVRADRRAKIRSAEHVENVGRWEFREGMHGNTYEVIDHLRLRWYRQDLPVDGQGDLIDGYLPFRCDYCNVTVLHISSISYKCVYWYYVRPKLTDAAWKRTEFQIKYSCCESCLYGPLPVPVRLIGHHMTELFQGGHLIFKQQRKKD